MPLDFIIFENFTTMAPQHSSSLLDYFKGIAAVDMTSDESSESEDCKDYGKQDAGINSVSSEYDEFFFFFFFKTYAYIL